MSQTEIAEKISLAIAGYVIGRKICAITCVADINDPKFFLNIPGELLLLLDVKPPARTREAIRITRELEAGEVVPKLPIVEVVVFRDPAAVEERVPCFALDAFSLTAVIP